MPKLNSILIIFLMGLFWQSQAAKTETNDLFTKGIQQYQQKDYAGAEQSWSQWTKRNPLDASALLNQALAYSQQKKWGLALAYLREAQLISPRDRRLQQAHEFVLNSVKTRGFRNDDSLLNSFDSAFGKYFLLPELLSLHWLLSAIVLVTLGKLFRQRRRAQYQGLPIPLWRKRHWTLSTLWGLLSLVLLFKVATALDQKATVITAGAVAVRSGPMPEAAQLADIPEGALISIRDYYKDWVQVHFDNVPVGWLQRKDLLLLTPEGFR